MASAVRFIARGFFHKTFSLESRPINRAEDAINLVPTTYPCYFVKHDHVVPTAYLYYFIKSKYHVPTENQARTHIVL